MNINIKHNSSLQLSYLTNAQLYTENNLVTLLLSLYPYFNSTKIVIKRSDLQTIFPHIDADTLFSTFHVIFLRFVKLNLISNYTVLDYYSKDILHFDIHENNILAYQVLLTNELRTRETAKEMLLELTIWTKKGIVEYVSPTGINKKIDFDISKNEYIILHCLAQTPNTPVKFSLLTEKLNNPRRGAEDSSAKDRLRDTIKAIKKKIGPERITRERTGYVLHGTIHIIP